MLELSSGAEFIVEVESLLLPQPPPHPPLPEVDTTSTGDDPQAQLGNGIAVLGEITQIEIFEVAHEFVPSKATYVPVAEPTNQIEGI